jgi:DNA polymerase III epsilon subunit-like protein
MMHTLEPIDLANLVAIDMETGGTLPGVHPVLQIGAAFVPGPGLACHFFSQHVLPQEGMEMEAEALAKNGYTAERWAEAGAVPLPLAVERFRAWLESLRPLFGGGRLSPLAHNASFDRGFCDWMARHVGNPLSEVLDYHWECSAGLMRSLMRAKLLWPGSVKLAALKELSGFRGLALEYHDAQDDAAACWHGYRWLLELARTGHIVEEH